MSKTTILIVEDDGILVMYLEDLLTRQGYTVLPPVSTGEEAIQVVIDRKPSIILMDIELGGKMNGITAAERINLVSDTPIIFVTGFSQDPLLEQAKVTAPYGYLVKPVPERELAATLGMALYKHKLDQQVRESEARYRSLIEQASDGIFLSDKEGNYIEVNSAGCAMLGYTREEILKLNMSDVIFSEDGQTAPMHLAEFLSGAPRRAERHMKRKDGTAFPVEISAKLLDDGNLQGIVRDITERRQAEDALKAREHLLNKILDILPVGLWVADKNGRLTRTNPAGVKIWGQEKLVGQEGYESYRARRLPSREEVAPGDWALAHTIREGVTVQDELLEIDTFDGQKKTILNYSAPVLDDQGQVEAAVVVNLDISERQRTEDTLLFLAKQGWLAGEDFFNSLAQFLSKTLDMDYVCIDQLEGEGQSARTLAVYFDGHFEDNVSYQLKDTPCGNVVGKTICCFPNQVRLLFPKDVVLQNMVAESYVGTTLWSYTGQPIGLIAVIGRAPLADPRLAETILKLVAVRAAGELERKNKEMELLEERALLKRRVEERTQDLSLANAELSNSLRLKDEFLANMSHELRTPLTGILGLSEALQLKIYGDVNQKQATAIENIEKCGHHLLNLINDILDLSKVGVGMIKLEPALIPLRDICQSSIMLVREISQLKKIHVALEIGPGVEYIRADERRLKQILVNLLSNAVKFTPEGEKVGLIVKGDAANQRIQFVVWDHGIGIPFDELKRLFHPFTQLDSTLSKKYEGTGLGLSLVLKMVELHGGGVSVESEPGRGSRFIVTLPWDGLQKEAGEVLSPDVPAKTRGILTAEGALVLIVEDNELNLHFLEDTLSSIGYRVITAHNGEEGLTMARENKPDVILMDIQMPILDGIQTAHRIRADSSLKNIPIIALTALAMSGDRNKCFEAGMNDYLSKPASIAELKKAIGAQILIKARG